MEYSLSPDDSIVNLIDRMAAAYFSVYRPDITVSAWITPQIERCIMKQNFITPNSASLTVHTSIGPISVITKPDLEWPIFVGSEQELKDNSFDASMEEILCA